MTVVRELVARLGFQVDKSGFKEAERALESVRKSVARTSDMGQRVREAEAAVARRGLRGGHLRFDEDAQGNYRDRAGRLRNARGRFIGGKGGAATGAAAAAAAGGGGGELMKTLGKLAAFAGLEHAVESMVEMASSAEETANVLSAVFGADGQKQVTDWSENMAVELGRSKYSLQKMAGDLGAVAAPMLGNADRAREMSETFTQLAVDMASFYNSTDEDALAALRSAMTGEVESIKRYGVVMNEATMQEYARTQGIHKKISAMSIAEKTELRYGYIMKVTKAAQGDAARTSEGYANSIKRVKAMMTDFGTDMGRAVLPKIEKLLVFIRHGIEHFRDFTKNTALLQTAMWTLGGIAGALALELLAPFILPAAAVLALVLLVEDLYQLFNGGESAIGDFVDAMFGLGTTEEMVNGLRDAWDWLSSTFSELQQTMPDIIGFFQMLQGLGEDIMFTLDSWSQSLIEFTELLIGLPGKISKFLGQKAAGLLGFDVKEEQEDVQGSGLYRSATRTKGRGLNAEVATRDDVLAERQRTREDRIRSGVAERDKARAERREQQRHKQEQRQQMRQVDEAIRKNERDLDADNLNPKDRAALEELGVKLRGQRADMEAAAAAGDPTKPRFGVARLRPTATEPTLFPPALVAAPPGAAAGGGVMQHTVVQQSNTNTIHVNGGNPNEVRKVVQQVLDSNNRRAAAALPRPAGA